MEHTMTQARVFHALHMSHSEVEEALLTWANRYSPEMVQSDAKVSLSVDYTGKKSARIYWDEED